MGITSCSGPATGASAVLVSFHPQGVEGLARPCPPMSQAGLPVHVASARSAAPMPDPRISHIELDEATILWRNADIEQERRIAIFDLIEENTFKPLRAFSAGHEGPYRLALSVHDGRLVLAIADEAGQELETLILGLGRFRRPIREYFAICDSYYQAIRKATAQEIDDRHGAAGDPQRSGGNAA